MAWQPDGWNDDMSEAPRDGTEFLGALNFAPNVWCVQVMKYKNGAFRLSWDDDKLWLTHWRQLPSPPSKQED